MAIIGDRPPPEFASIAGAHIFEHGHLPAVAAYCRQLKLVELINTMVPSQMAISPGHVVQAMVLDILSGRSPLYHVEHFLEGLDIELLLGENIPAHAFNDTNLARTLDAIFDAGTSRIMSEIGLRATKSFSLDPSVVSYDTTSTSVWGEYRACESDEPPPGPVIAYGHSKDNQPNLKQFMTELLCIDRGVPIFSRTLDGNSSDKNSNNEMLTRITKIMAKQGLGPGAFVYVADSAMVTKSNLEEIGKTSFITRLPAVYGECNRVIAEAVNRGEWNNIGTQAECVTSKSRPAAIYRTQECEVTLYEQVYRAIVIHSSSHDKRRRKKLEKAISQSAKQLNVALKKLQDTYFCRSDAQVAAKQAEKMADSLHRVITRITPFEKRLRGRPPIGRPPATETHYTLEWELVQNEAGVKEQELLAGCFVLLTNVPREGKNTLQAEEVLRVYKGQYGVESDFAFLKDPLIVNDLFIKTPSRIDALGMILVLALMIWRLMERSMRAYVENEDCTLPGWDRKRTLKPTAFMMSKAITGITVILLNGKRALLCAPGSDKLEFLTALGCGTQAFTDPRCRCRPIIKRKLKYSG